MTYVDILSVFSLLFKTGSLLKEKFDKFYLYQGTKKWLWKDWRGEKIDRASFPINLARSGGAVTSIYPYPVASLSCTSGSVSKMILQENAFFILFSTHVIFIYRLLNNPGVSFVKKPADLVIFFLHFSTTFRKCIFWEKSAAECLVKGAENYFLQPCVKKMFRKCMMKTLLDSFLIFASRF